MNDTLQSLHGPNNVITTKIEILKEAMELLKPVEHITRELSFSNVTCSKTFFVVECLHACLECKKPASEIREALQQKLLTEIHNILTNIEIKKPILSKATSRSSL